MRTVARWSMAFAAVVGIVGSLRAQCPDGSPPPCARPAARLPKPPPNSVAVLYFDNLSRDTADAYLADGLTEEIIVRLGQVRRLEVKSRFAVQRLRARPMGDPAEMGRTLAAAYLVSGSLQRAGERVRVRVELVRAATRTRVWGDVFDRSSADVLGIEEDIAVAAVSGITGQILPEERARLAVRETRDPQAYDLFLRGRHVFNTTDEASLRSALGYFERAATRDPNFAAAYAATAEAWYELADIYEAPRVAYARGREAAERAFALDSSAAQAYVALVYPTLALDWNFARAESLARRAVALDPRDPDAHYMLGFVTSILGLGDEGVGELIRAWELDSLSVWRPYYVVWGLAQNRRYRELEAFLGRVPHAVDTTYQAGILHLIHGECAAAAGELARAYGSSVRMSAYTQALSCAGRREDLTRFVDSLKVARRTRYVNAAAVALGYAALEMPDSAFEWLDRAIDERTVWVVYLNLQTWDMIRADPRFAAVQRRIGLMPGQRE